MKDFKLLLKYGITGILTTGVNYAVYFLLCRLDINYLIANGAAWAAAVFFSYWVNRQIVFHSGNVWYREMLSFCSLRLITLFIETALMFFAVDCLRLSSNGAKVVISIVTVLGNYIICQTKIFKKGADNHE